WALGEVRSPETVHRRTRRPVPRGLFCEHVFGIEGYWECACGKERGRESAGATCGACGQKVDLLRHRRLGSVELHSPIAHLWFHRPLARLLGWTMEELRYVVYFVRYAVIDPRQTALRRGQLLTEDEYRHLGGPWEPTAPEVDMGAEACRRLLEATDLRQLGGELRARLKEPDPGRRGRRGPPSRPGVGGGPVAPAAGAARAGRPVPPAL